MITQIAIMFFGASAIWFVSRKEKWKRWGYILGILGQPFWIYESYSNEQWGILIMTLFYAYSWIQGILNYWIKTPSNKDYDRGLDLLARESISTENEKNLFLKGCIRVVPLQIAILFFHELKKGTLEEFYQKNKDLIDTTRPPETSKPILESFGFNISIK